MGIRRNRDNGSVMETVTFSTSQVLLLKRLFLNVLSGNPAYKTANRKVIKDAGVERFLIERKWCIRGDTMVFEGSDAEAGSFLEALIQGSLQSGTPAAAGDHPEPVTVSEADMKLLVGALEHEERPKGVFCFPCVFRVTAQELLNMLRLNDKMEVTTLHSALTVLIQEQKLGLTGSFGIADGGKRFVYVRECSEIDTQ